MKERDIEIELEGSITSLIFFWIIHIYDQADGIDNII